MIEDKLQRKVLFMRNALCMIFLVLNEIQTSSSVGNNNCVCRTPKNIYWQNASDFCESIGSSLPNFENSNTASILNQTCLYGNNKYWTGRYKLESKWIDIAGCYSANDVIPPDNKTWEVDATQCFAYCHQYTYFGLTNKTCVCLHTLPSTANKTKDACVPCQNTKYVCGKDGYIAVYREALGPDNTPIPKTNWSPDCVSATCTDGNSPWSYKTDICSTPNAIQCTDQTFKGYGSWMGALSVCQFHNSNLAGADEITFACANNIKNGQIWAYAHKDVVYMNAATSGIFRHYSPVRCEYISFSHPNPLFGNCENIGGVACIKNGEDCQGSIKTTKNILDSDSTSRAPTTGNKPAMTSGSSAENNNPVSTNTYSRASSRVTIHSVTKETTQSPSEVTNSNERSSTENHQIIYIAVGCSVGALLISVVLIIVCCKVRRPRTKSSRYDNQAKSKLSHINNNNYNKDKNNLTSSNTHQHKNNYTVPSYNFVKQPYEVIDAVDPKIDLGSRNHVVGNDSRATKPNSYTEPWSDDIGHVFKHKIVDNETTLPKNNILNNQYSLVRKRGDDNHEIKEDHEIEFKKDDYDHINNVKVEYKKKHSIKDETCDKGPINRTTDEDDYDQFERNNVNKSGLASNYDHVAMHRKISRTKDKFKEEDDLEDYDHLQKSPKRPESVDSTYDHTHTVNYEDTYNHFNPKHPSANPDTYGHLPNEDDDDDYATADNQDEDNKISGDYEISDELPAVRVSSGNRESHYTSVTLPEMDA